MGNLVFYVVRKEEKEKIKEEMVELEISINLRIAFARHEYARGEKRPNKCIGVSPNNQVIEQVP